MRYPTLIPVALSFVLATSVAEAGSVGGDWQALGPWGGSDIVLKSAGADTDRAYALSPSAGLFRTDNRGETWTWLSPPSGRSRISSAAQLAITQDNPDRIVMVFDDQYAYLSNDGGSNWHLIDSSQTPEGAPTMHITAVAIEPGNPQNISSFHGGAYRAQTRSPEPSWRHSDDGGQTFQNRPLPSPVVCPAGTDFHPGHRTIVSADFSAGGTLVVSENSVCLGYIAFLYRLVELQDGPSTLLASIELAMPSASAIPSAKLAFAGEDYLWLAGSSLFRIAGEDLDRAYLRGDVIDIAVDAEGVLTVPDESGLLQSFDAGASWSMHDGSGFGLGGTQPPYGFTVIAFNDGELLASNSHGVFGKPADSPSWTFRSHGLSALNVRAIAHTADENRLWAGIGESTAALLAQRSSSRVIYRSTDNGQTWNASSNIDTFARYLRRVVIDPPMTGGPATVYAAGSGCADAFCTSGMQPSAGIYKSVDDGTTWQALSEGLHEPNFGNTRGLIVDPDWGAPSTRRLAATPQFGGPVARSFDSGETWSSESQGLPATMGNPGLDPSAWILAASPARPETLFLSTLSVYWNGQDPPPTVSAGLFRSRDFGSNWEHAAQGLPRFGTDGSHSGVSAIAMHPTNPQVAWVVALETEQHITANSRVFKTVDGGTSWSYSGNGLPEGDYRALVVELERPEHLYVSGNPGVYHSSNGGISWQRLGTSGLGSKSTLSVGSRHLYAGGSTGIHRIAVRSLRFSPAPRNVLGGRVDQR